MKHRSVPTDGLLAHLTYRSLADALPWLTAAFGFAEHYRYGDADGPPSGVQRAWFMLSGARGGGGSPPQGPSRTPALTVFVEDVEARFAAARAAGARITEDLDETVYGERQYGVEDLEGHVWLFSQHVRDVSPEQWGARMAGRSAASHPAGAGGGT